MSHLLLIAHVLLVTSTPAVVVWIVSASAARAAGPRADPPRDQRARQRLWIATSVSWAAFALWAWRDVRIFLAPYPPALVGIVELGAFAVLSLAFGLPALREAADAAKERVRFGADATKEEVREARLRPRRVTDYLPAPLPVLPLCFAMVAVGFVAAGLWEPGGSRRPLLGWGFSLAAVAFAALYALWIREEACGPDASGLPAAERDRERRGAIRRIFGAQMCLVATFAVLAVVVVQVDWASSAGPVVAAGAAVVGGVVGVIGCAYALASGVRTRKLQAEVRDTLR